jgi:glycerophosphoryl diester phosphodiesterase
MKKPSTRRDFLKQAAAAAGLFVLPSAVFGGQAALLEKRTRIFDAPNTPRKPRFIAHRGCLSLAPENSLPAFEEAAKRGFWAIETDVRITKDARLVCCHDATLKKMFGAGGRIADLTFDEIQKLRLSSGNRLGDHPEGRLRMPLFSEYLEICKGGGCVPFIEIKDDVTSRVLRLVRDLGMEDGAVISSIEFAHVEEARRLSKKVFIHHIFSDGEHMGKLAALGYAGLSYDHKNLDAVPAGLIETTHRAGVRVCLRAGDTRETVLKMLEMGLDYIPTNAVIEM